jgi:hypothetical protein
MGSLLLNVNPSQSWRAGVRLFMHTQLVPPLLERLKRAFECTMEGNRLPFPLLMRQAPRAQGPQFVRSSTRAELSHLQSPRPQSHAPTCNLIDLRRTVSMLHFENMVTTAFS